jgi:GNAT superfamily N-acetyltransferase
MWQTKELDNPTKIEGFLQTDRLYAAYAVGDLEPALFEQCQWFGAERAGRLAALALLYHGLAPPALFLMGNSSGLQMILEEISWPEEVYLTCRPAHLPLTQRVCTWRETIAMWRMVLDPARFRPVRSACVRLTPADAGQLAGLYALGGGMAFNVTQLQQGIFYGVREEGRLVAAAGTHLLSPTYRLAAVGNVFTHPDHHRKGYGLATTSTVVSELLKDGIRDIVLNVSQHNAPAIRLYERLGFERYCPFLEGPASR